MVEVHSSPDPKMRAKYSYWNECPRGPEKLLVPDAYVDSSLWPLVVTLHYDANDLALSWQRYGLEHRIDNHSWGPFFELLPKARKRGGMWVWESHGTRNCGGCTPVDEDEQNHQNYVRCDDPGDCCVGCRNDDKFYVMDLISVVKSRYTIDPDRVYALGFSGGGFFAQLLACLYADQFAVVVSRAAIRPTLCKPTGRHHVLLVHGTVDMNTLYDGCIGVDCRFQYMSAPAAADAWAKDNGCDLSKTLAGGTIAGPSIQNKDLITGKRDLFPVCIPDPLDATKCDIDETIVYEYDKCPDGASVQHWKSVGYEHLASNENFTNYNEQVLDYILRLKRGGRFVRTTSNGQLQASTTGLGISNNATSTSQVAVTTSQKAAEFDSSPTLVLSKQLMVTCVILSLLLHSSIQLAS